MARDEPPAQFVVRAQRATGFTSERLRLLFPASPLASVFKHPWARKSEKVTKKPKLSRSDAKLAFLWSSSCTAAHRQRDVYFSPFWWTFDGPLLVISSERVLLEDLSDTWHGFCRFNLT
jgi:hypothetical protein